MQRTVEVVAAQGDEEFRVEPVGRHLLRKEQGHGTARGPGFFLDGVETAATDAERGIVAMASLINADRKRLLAAPRVGAVALRLFELLPLMPRFTIEQARQKLDTTFPTATAAVKLLHDLGMLSELTGQKKNRLFSYAAYVELLAGSP